MSGLFSFFLSLSLYRLLSRTAGLAYYGYAWHIPERPVWRWFWFWFCGFWGGGGMDGWMVGNAFKNFGSREQGYTPSAWADSGRMVVVGEWEGRRGGRGVVWFTGLLLLLLLSSSLGDDGWTAPGVGSYVTAPARVGCGSWTCRNRFDQSVKPLWCFPGGEGGMVLLV